MCGGEEHLKAASYVNFSAVKRELPALFSAGNPHLQKIDAIGGNSNMLFPPKRSFS